MFTMLRHIIEYRDLMLMLTARDLRVRYKQAAMGFLWAIFMPMVAVFAGILIKKAMSVVSHQPLNIESIISISVKVLPWTFFISSIRFSVQALVGNSTLVTKIYFPRAVLVLSAILACLFDFGVALIVMVLLVTVLGVGVSAQLIWLPVIFLLLLLFTFGLGLLLASANLFYRDVKYIVEIILMFGIFFTPVFYEASSFGQWKPLMMLNPMGSILESLNRTVVLHLPPEPYWMAYAVIMSVGTFLMGASIFQRAEPYFAENI